MGDKPIGTRAPEGVDHDGRLARRREFADQWNEAARRACTAYLDVLGMYGDQRRAQEFDNLDDGGKGMWRVVVWKAIEHAPEQLIRDVRGGV